MLIGHYLERLLACLHCPGRELSIKLLIRALSQARRLESISSYGMHEFNVTTRNAWREIAGVPSLSSISPSLHLMLSTDRMSYSHAHGQM